MGDATQAAFTLLSHRLMTNDATREGLNYVGPEVEVASFLSATIFVYHAAIETAVNDPGIDYILQGRWPTGASANEDWINLWTFTSGTTAAVASEITGTEAAGETTLAVDADPTAAFTPGSIIYIEDKSVIADGEWNQVAISATAANIVTIIDGLTNAKDSLDTIWTQAERFIGEIDLTGLSYVRMIVQNADVTGVNTHFKAHMIAMTDIE